MNWATEEPVFPVVSIAASLARPQPSGPFLFTLPPTWEQPRVERSSPGTRIGFCRTGTVAFPFLPGASVPCCRGAFATSSEQQSLQTVTFSSSEGYTVYPSCLLSCLPKPSFSTSRGPGWALQGSWRTHSCHSLANQTTLLLSLFSFCSLRHPTYPQR